MNGMREVRRQWEMLSERERAWLRVAGTVVSLFVVWSALFQPALHSLRSAAAERAQAQAALERLQVLAAQASNLRTTAASAGAQTPAGRAPGLVIDDTSRALVTAALGSSARLQAQGPVVTVHFEGVSGEQLRQGLKTLRVRWGAQALEAELAPGPQGIRGRIQFEWQPN
ncbi:MAG: hypothetical protein EBS47_05115 [Betaproteobacteria bacterium]|nr:hypothetical protein [Betaproteobacteria bacterium]NBU49477.1 hypothetical protein [Betaproteobacteria bacterium]